MSTPCGDWSSGVDEEQPATVAAKKNNNIVKVNSAFVAAKKLDKLIQGQGQLNSTLCNCG